MRFYQNYKRAIRGDGSESQMLAAFMMTCLVATVALAILVNICIYLNNHLPTFVYVSFWVTIIVGFIGICIKKINHD